jgi:hypothetical protein
MAFRTTGIITRRTPAGECTGLPEKLMFMTVLQNYAGIKHRSYKITQLQMFEMLDKAKPLSCHCSVSFLSKGTFWPYRGLIYSVYIYIYKNDVFWDITPWKNRLPEELSASIIRETGIVELGTTLAETSNRGTMVLYALYVKFLSNAYRDSDSEQGTKSVWSIYVKL